MFYVAAAVGAVVSFFVGCLWYTVIFGKQWQELMDFTDDKVKSIFKPARIFCALLSEWFGAACLTGLFFNLTTNIWVSAVMAMVFVCSAIIKLGIFDGKKAKLIFINAGYSALSVWIIACSVFFFLK